MEAPAVVVLIVTDCPELYVPAGGANVGVATVPPVPQEENLKAPI
jgi:hypothetical protein